MSSSQWHWTTKIDYNGCKDGNSNDLKLSKYKVEISHNLDVFDPVKNMEQSVAQKILENLTFSFSI